MARVRIAGIRRRIACAGGSTDSLAGAISAPSSTLNGYRLADAEGALADPAQADVPVLTIALDAGFGSTGPVNRAF